jgi:hypothetical protein
VLGNQTVNINEFIGDKKELQLQEKRETQNAKKRFELGISVLQLNLEALKHKLVKIGNLMPYRIKGKCIHKKTTGKKVGCTKGSVKKYLAALQANVRESSAKKLNFKTLCLTAINS